MTIALAIGIVVIALLLLSNDRIPLELSSIAIVVLLVYAGLVTPEEALSGFSSDAAIFIFALLAMTQGLGATGVMQLVGRQLVLRSKQSPRVYVVLMLGAVCAFSSMASNTAVAAAFLPVVLSSSSQLGIAPRRLLMPVAYASMLGGMIFLFGSSTNLVVSATMDRMGLGRLGFAELAPAGLPLALIGIAATIVLVRRLLPERTRQGADEVFPIGRREYVTELVPAPRSPLLGQPIRALPAALGVDVRGVMHQGSMAPPDSELLLGPDDRILIAGDAGDIVRLKDLPAVSLQQDLRRKRVGHAEVLVEVLMPPTSGLTGRSLRELRFADRFGFVVLAVDRHPGVQFLRNLSVMGKLAAGRSLRSLPLSVGDMLLMSGPPERVEYLARSGEFTVLGGVDYASPRYQRAALAALIFGLTVLAAGLRVAPPAIVGLTGMLVMVMTGCLDARTAFRVDWRIIIMIGALLTLGLAMERSGAGAWLARGVVPLATYAGAHGVLAVVMLLTILLSVPMSNQAAALVILPMSINAASSMGLDPRTFAIGTCLAASCSFMTPLEPAAALVYGPGGYRFSDFVRVGLPLTLLMLALLTFAVPMVWPFTPR